MHIQLNYLIVIAAAVAGVVINALWYTVLFKGPVAKLRAADPTIAGRDPAPPMYAVAILGQLLVALVLAATLKIAGADSVFEGVHAAALLWLGFTAPAMTQVLVFGYRNRGFVFIDAPCWLVGAVAMGAILGQWG